jgi:D-alanine--poly(phosphoribitol) ligase subunit 1
VVTLPDDQSPVLVKGHKDPEMLIGFLGAVKSGHPYIPIDSSIPPGREEAIRVTSKATLTLTPGTINRLAHAPRIFKKELPLRSPSPDDPWYIIFTSGSTGEPKGVVITRECLEDFVTWMMEEQCFNQNSEVFLNQAPYSFDLSVMDLYLSLATGGSLYNLTREEIAEPRDLFQSLGRSNATIWVSTPSFAKLCLMEGSFSRSLLPGVRKFLFCGETLPVEVAAGLLQRFPDSEVWNTYGPTEATCATTSLKITRSILSRYHPLPVGYPKPQHDPDLPR